MSKRLKAIESYIPDGSILVDVGTDHAQLIISAFDKGIINKAYGIDINEKPLKRARANLKEKGYLNRTELILADGLSTFKKTADVFVIAGIGGETAYNILKKYKFKPKHRIIVQINSKHLFFRENLVRNSLIIIHEEFFFENNQPVFIYILKSGKRPLTFKEIVLGPCLMKLTSEDYRYYLENKLEYLEEIIKYDSSRYPEYCIINRFLKKGDVL